MDQSEELAREDRRAGSHVDLGQTRWVLIGVLVVYVISLFLPFAGGVPGWKMLIFSAEAAEVQTKVTEYIFLILSFIGIVLMTGLMLLTKRFAFAAIGWMLSAVSFFVSVLAIWIRRTSTAFDAGLYHGPGIYLAVLCVGVAAFAYAPVVLSRTKDQAEIEQRRIELEGKDAIAQAQKAATETAAEGEENPLLIDDRRARAAERHKKYIQNDS